MTESHRYSVAELDALRRCVEMKYLYGTYDCPQNGGMSRCFIANEKEKAVEERVRTHMLAGHTAEDLLASERSTAVAAATGRTDG